MNPIKMLKNKERLELFLADHPKVAPYMHLLSREAIEEGTVLTLTAVRPDGKKYEGNIKINANDVETLRQVLGEAGGE